jgi:pyruvate, water dikinase
MINHKSIVWFEEVTKHDVGLVGGKGANLGEMTNAHLPIPYGFVVTSHAYFNFIKESDLDLKMKDVLKSVNCDNPHELQQVSRQLQDLILKAEMPHTLAKEIIHFYENLSAKEEKYLVGSLSDFKLSHHKIKHLYQQPYVAVRSSATAEDLPNASFAGQQETYLNVKGETNLLIKVKDCWASLFTERAIYYRHEQGFDHFKVGLAAVIQRMVQSDKSGIAFSIDPVTNDKNKIIIEAIFGLGEYIVQGKVTPDHYEVDKRSILILKKEKKYQSSKYIKATKDNKEVKLSKSVGSQQKLTEEEIVEVALLVKDIEHHYYFPQDIEWAIENNRVFIVQSRPITTIKNIDNSKKKDANDTAELSQMTPIAVGSPASPGVATGPVRLIHSPKEIDRMKHGDILVAPQTNPDYVPAMKKAAAIVTEKGGRTSHAAIVSRELGVPAVVGTEKITKIVHEDEIITVNGSTGEIYKGKVVLSHTSPNSLTSPTSHRSLHTVTKVYVNLAEPEEAEKVAKLHCDGIGLLRAEFMIAGIGTHPKEFIKNKEEHKFINILTNDLLKFVKPFHPRQVVYRATDFKTNEYKHLIGGAKYEPREENPMIGFRGASRYIVNPDVFVMELAAIRNVWEKGYNNLHLMIPFVRTTWELIKIKEIVREFGLFDLDGFKLWIMVEVPACALAVEDFIKIGIDGVSIGTNDLTMMLLGVDRDNSEVANIYDERNPTIISVLEYVVKTCADNNVTASICGQAASDYPEIVERLVKAGITSVSVNPDAIDRTRASIFEIEKKIYKK